MAAVITFVGLPLLPGEAEVVITGTKPTGTADAAIATRPVELEVAAAGAPGRAHERPLSSVRAIDPCRRR